MVRFLKYRPKMFWDFWALDFQKDEEQVKLHPWNLRALELILERHGQGILEIGCGFGRNMKELLGRGCPPESLHGLDISARMLKRCREYLDGAPVDLRQGTADRLPYSDKAFDVVYVSLVLMHVPGDQVRKCMAESMRVARKRVVFLEEYRPLSAGTLTANINDYTFAHDHRGYLAGFGLSPRTFEVMGKWAVVSVDLDGVPAPAADR